MKVFGHLMIFKLHRTHPQTSYKLQFQTGNQKGKKMKKKEEKNCVLLFMLSCIADIYQICTLPFSSCLTDSKKIIPREKHSSGKHLLWLLAQPLSLIWNGCDITKALWVRVCRDRAMIQWQVHQQLVRQLCYHRKATLTSCPTGPFKACIHTHTLT